MPADENETRARLFLREIERALYAAIDRLRSGEPDECEVRLEEIRAAFRDQAGFRPARLDVALALLRGDAPKNCEHELEAMISECRSQ